MMMVGREREMGSEMGREREIVRERWLGRIMECLCTLDSYARTLGKETQNGDVYAALDLCYLHKNIGDAIWPLPQCQASGELTELKEN